MTTFVDALPLEQLPTNTTKIVEAGGKKVLLANDDGDVHALSPYCTHDGGDMDGEEVEDHEITCHRHGARFDVRTGEAVRMPAVFGLTPYDVKVEDGMIQVAIP